MSRKNKKILRLCMALIIGLLLYSYQQPKLSQPIINKAEQSQPGLYTVTKFTDGDTITVDMNGTPEKIRMIGVDTPETNDPRKEVQCFGKAASNFTKQLIGNKRVRLEADPTNADRDRYNRLLRYVYLPDGTLINAEIIKQGYGFAYTFFQFTKLEEFKKYQNEAEYDGRGLWGSCQVEILENGQIRTNPQ
jgi:endonuclease YncB( thermonuclease family)